MWSKQPDMGVNSFIPESSDQNENDESPGSPESPGQFRSMSGSGVLRPVDLVEATDDDLLFISRSRSDMDNLAGDLPSLK